MEEKKELAIGDRTVLVCSVLGTFVHNNNVDSIIL